MFEIYIKDFKRGGSVIGTETRVQSIPAALENDLKLVNPIVKVEMGNAESFEFSIEGGTQFCDAFLQMKTFLRVVYDGTIIFCGRVLTVDNGFRGTRKVRCEGPLAFFNDSPVSGTKEEKRRSVTVYEYMSELINNHNSWVRDSRRSFSLGLVPGSPSYGSISVDQQLPNTERKYGQDGWTDTKAALEDLRSHYGGYFRVRTNTIGGGNVLDWMNHYFNANEISQTVEVGKNILDISSVNEIDNIFTAIIPIGNNNEAKGDGHFYLDQQYVTVPEICGHFSRADLSRGYHSYEDYASAIDRYGYIYKTINFDDATTKEKLYDDACEWIRNNYQGEVPKFTVKAVDMRQIGENTSKITVGDRVRIRYPIIDEDGNAVWQETTQTCISINYDLYNPENNAYTFGIPANIMTKSYGLKKQSKSTTTPTVTEPQKETPRTTSSGGGKGRSVEDQLIDWFTNHKIHYNGVKPYSEAYGRSGQYGPKAGDNPSHVDWESDEFFISKEHAGFATVTLWRAIRSEERFKPGYSRETYEVLKVKNSEQAAEAYKKQYLYDDEWHLKNESVGSVTLGLIYQFNLIDYVKYEYGIDLSNGSVISDKLPTRINLEDGTVIETKEVTYDDGTVTTVTAAVLSKNGTKVTFGAYGRDIKAIEDDDGNVHYFETKPDGSVVEVENLRDLNLQTVTSTNFIGTMVKSGVINEVGTYDFYKFGQAIENTLEGQLVVSYVEGDKLMLGDRNTKWSYNVASLVNQNWVRPWDVIDGKIVYKDPVGTASYRGYYDDNTGDFVIDPNGPIAFTGIGVWDEKSLALQGGIITGETGTNPDGTKQYTSYVKSNRLVIGDHAGDLKVKDALLSSGVISEDEYGTASANALVAEEVYTKKLNSVDASIRNLQTYKLTTSELDSKISDLEVVHVKTIQAAKGTTNATLALHTVSALDRLYIGTEADTIDLISNGVRDSVIDLQVARVSGTNTYQISKKTIASHAEWTVVGSFDVATSLLGNWSGSTSLPVLTVQDQAPVPHTYKIGFGTNTAVDCRLEIGGNGTPTAYTNTTGTVVEKYLNVPIKVTEITGNPDPPTRYVHTIPGVDGTVVYNQGWNGCRNAISYPRNDIGQSTNYVMSVGIPRTNGNAATDAQNYTLLFRDHWFPGVGYHRCAEIGYGSSVVARLDVQSSWDDRWSAGRSTGQGEGRAEIRNNIKGYGTVSPSSSRTYYASDKGYEGISSITVNVTQTAPWAEACGSTSERKDVTVTADGKSSTFSLSKTTYRPYGVSQNVKCVNLSYSGRVVGRIAIE